MGEIETERAALLGNAFEKFNCKEYLDSDPVGFVHEYSDPRDQEIVAAWAGVLAYGNVKQIRKSCSDLLGRVESTGLHPRKWLDQLGKKGKFEEAQELFDGFVHRFYKGNDMVLFSAALREILTPRGTLAKRFVQNHSEQNPHIQIGLESLMKEWKARAIDLAKSNNIKIGRSFFHMLSSPEQGSTCKRWCMMIRWMVRNDEVDPGTWNEILGRVQIRPDQLVIPLDVHTGRICSGLGMTSRKSLNWKAALEVTEYLKKYDAEDPVKYDFALSRLGILDFYKKSDHLKATGDV